MNPVTQFCAITVGAVSLLIAGALMDGPEDFSADWDQSSALMELQAAEAGTARQQRAAQALCTQERGPNSEARWTTAGDLVCTTRRGVVIASKP